MAWYYLQDGVLARLAVEQDQLPIPHPYGFASVTLYWFEDANGEAQPIGGEGSP